MCIHVGLFVLSSQKVKNVKYLFGYSGARGTFFWGAEFLVFLEYFFIYVSHDPNFLLLDRAMLELHF